MALTNTEVTDLASSLTDPVATDNQKKAFVATLVTLLIAALRVDTIKEHFIRGLEKLIPGTFLDKLAGPIYNLVMMVLEALAGSLGDD